MAPFGAGNASADDLYGIESKTLRLVRRKSQAPVTTELQNQMDVIPSTRAHSTIRFAPGQLTISCQDMGHFVEQLVLVAKALDSDNEGLLPQIESMPDHKPINREHATRSGSKAELRSAWAYRSLPKDQ
jgi:hypothetical protein